MAELNDGRLIEPQAFTQLDALGIGGVLPQHNGDRVADILKKHKGQQRNGEHHRYGLQQATQYESKHRRKRQNGGSPGRPPPFD
ncbi:hypothetical protein D9M70_625490 [compost metagenome]